MPETCDARAERQVADRLRTWRGEIDHLPRIAGRVDVGDVLPHDLQPDLGRIERVARQLNGREKGHGSPSFLRSPRLPGLPGRRPDRSSRLYHMSVRYGRRSR